MLFVSAGCDLEIMEITWCKKMSFFFFNTSVTWDYQSLERTRLERPQLGSSNHRLGIITGLGLHLLTKGKVSLQGLHWYHCWVARCDHWAWTRSWSVCTGSQTHKSGLFFLQGMQKVGNIFESKQAFFFVWYRCWKNTAELLVLVPMLFKAILQQCSRKERKFLSPLNSRKIVSLLHQNLCNRSILRMLLSVRVVPQEGRGVGRYWGRQSAV